MSRLAPGTPYPEGHKKAHFTVEQMATLETMKDPSYSLGVARAEFVNTLLHPDGSTSDDVTGMVLAAREQVTALLSGSPDADTLAKASEAARRVQEIETAIAEQRFLFIVNVDQIPVTYFQCGVSHNADVAELLIGATSSASETAP